ncbi:MAG: hypothetical protein H0V72_19990 [Bradyrhizobium sp.]|nr:hypothetical protein [Bradyrhizobium sp.]
MNKIIIGLADKTAELTPRRPAFLLIDDGPVADAFLDRFKRAKQFDPLSHSFNPLPMTYRKAREFASLGDAGKDTLTVRNGKRALVRLLLDAKRLESLVGSRSDEDKEAMSMVDDLLLSPVLRNILCKPTNFSFRSGNPPSSIVARLNRAELGEHDARILGSLLISQFKGQIIVPDFGFYARDFHASLIRENRLIAGIHTLAELDNKLRQMCLLMDKESAGCTFEDAELLAKYAGHVPHTNAFDAFVQRAMT